MPSIERPTSDEYAPFYAGYIAKVPAGDLVTLLRAQTAETRAMLEPLGDAGAREPYAPDKWSVNDVVQHLVDTERVMSYRALSVARGDTTALPGFDQDLFVASADANRRTIGELLAELAAVRTSSVRLAESLDAAALARVGSANGAPISARALLHIILGHERHHLRALQAAWARAGAQA